jgi:hypothetical protein
MTNAKVVSTGNATENFAVSDFITGFIKHVLLTISHNQPPAQLVLLKFTVLKIL